jgi:putative phosphoesterase
VAHSAEMKVDVIFNLGDMVGFGPYPDEVVKRIRKAGIPSIQGNVDRKVLKVPRKTAEWEGMDIPEVWREFIWAYDQLSRNNRKFMQELPDSMTVKMDGQRVMLVHATPTSRNDVILANTSDDELRKQAKKAGADFIFTGHSHFPLVRCIDEFCFINPGSVGRMIDGDPSASYAIVDIRKKRIKIAHFRIAYDIEKLLMAMRAKGFSELVIEMARQGIGREAVNAPQPDTNLVIPAAE